MSSHDLARVERKLRESGFRVTPQRLAVTRAVLASQDHPTADEIFRAVRRDFPTMSLTTVYHTLDTLRALGEVAELRVGDAVRFDPNRGPHHHLTCVACGQIVDIDRAGAPMPVPPAIAARYDILDYHVQFTGYCTTCRPRQATERGGPR